jgi:uncharacterized protein
VPEMHAYVLGLLRRVPDRPVIPQEEAERIQTAHVAHLNRLMQAGEIVIFGEIEEEGDLRGVVLFRQGSIERVRPLAEADPAVLHRRLTVDLYTWNAPDGLPLGTAAPPDPPDEPE